jgi:hypothetical protein
MLQGISAQAIALLGRDFSPAGKLNPHDGF